MSEKKVFVDRWDDQIEVSIPESSIMLEASVNPERPALNDVAEAIRQAIAAPMGTPPLAQLVDKNSKVAIAFDDPLKYSPKFEAVPTLIEELEKAGVDRKNITLVSANGTHDRPPKDDFKGFYRGRYPVLPDDIVDEFWPDRFISHNAHDPEMLVEMGESSMGNLVEHNRILVDADLIIYSGSVIPLIWGGYSGEGVVVGLGSARSIFSHHKDAVFNAPDSIHSDPRTQLFRRHKDAIIDRIEEFTGKKIFFLNGVCDAFGGWTDFFAGHYKEIQEAQWEAADRQHMHDAKQADIIVAGVPRYFFYDETSNPIINVVAAVTIMRSWVNKPILKEGGVVILVSKCDGHIDPIKHPTHAKAIEWFQSAGSAAAFEEQYFEKLYSDKELLQLYHERHAYHPVHPVWLFNENQYALDYAAKVIVATADNPEAPAKAGAEYAETFDAAMKDALAIAGPDPNILVLPNYFSYAPMVFRVE